MIAIIASKLEKQLSAGNEILVVDQYDLYTLEDYFGEYFAWPSYKDPLLTCSDQLKYKGRPIVCIGQGIEYDQ